MIPQVVDTVVYIEAGQVHTVYDVTTEVKVPAGLTAEDLARPVIQVSNFETGRPEYEIYTFNRQVVTVPLNDEDGEGESETGVGRIAKQEIEREIKSVAHGHVDVELKGNDEAVVYVSEGDIGTVIGKGDGDNSEIENRLGVEVDVRTHDEKPTDAGGSGADGRGANGQTGGKVGEERGTVVQPEITSRHVVIDVDDGVGETVEVRADGEYLFTATVGRGGEVQVSRGSAIAEELEDAIDRKRTVTVVPAR
jgi:ATPase